jgi:hypothetical protein
MKIAICGTEEHTLDQCPWDDKSWKIWGLAHRRNHYKRSDVLFEMHHRTTWKENPEFEGYLEWLDEEDRGVNVYTRWPDEYPACKHFLLENAIKLMGREYFASSFSYILAMAIMDGATEIALYGIGLTAEDEYQYQRPNAEYLLGLAQGMGIKITIAKGSALLNLPYVYGDGKPMTSPLIGQYEARLESIQLASFKLKSDHLRDLSQLEGAEHEIIEILKSLKDVDRGALQDG